MGLPCAKPRVGQIVKKPKINIFSAYSPFVPHPSTFSCPLRLGRLSNSRRSFKHLTADKKVCCERGFNMLFPSWTAILFLTLFPLIAFCAEDYYKVRTFLQLRSEDPLPETNKVPLISSSDSTKTPQIATSKKPIAASQNNTTQTKIPAMTLHMTNLSQ
jgi:hypothetical protein